VTETSEHAVDDEVAVVWMARQYLQVGPVDVHRTAAGLTPLSAVFRLCEDLTGGGVCIHCHKRIGFTEHFDDMPGLMMDTRADRDVLVPI
jgi:hypothetical protein